jgi:hypothetical protein
MNDGLILLCRPPQRHLILCLLLALNETTELSASLLFAGSFDFSESSVTSGRVRSITTIYISRCGVNTVGPIPFGVDIVASQCKDKRDVFSEQGDDMLFIRCIRT